MVGRFGRDGPARLGTCVCAPNTVGHGTWGDSGEALEDIGLGDTFPLAGVGRFRTPESEVIPAMTAAWTSGLGEFDIAAIDGDGVESASIVDDRLTVAGRRTRLEPLEPLAARRLVDEEVLDGDDRPSDVAERLTVARRPCLVALASSVVEDGVLIPP